MSTNDTYLAVFLGSKTSARMKTWMALPEVERRAKEHDEAANEGGLSHRSTEIA